MNIAPFSKEELNSIMLIVNSLEDEDSNAQIQWIEENNTYLIHYRYVVLAENLTDSEAYWLLDEINWK
ncbi:hypothetical protein [Siminovitchia fordii]|uniref:Uncharacterized protein n=1 Tax=Siminovitchia fordii TaxID=254759 RepID=A0ABQ4KCM8_9BACI|nr:hypothetical protein [Siminovitchia fordii]GIN22633.1 hypothetical protein J1TS3_37670 [Siminovitchia fordii]